MTSILPLENLHRVYCAGPLFNDAERREMERIADVLRGAGFEPFVPHSDGMEFARVVPFLIASGYEAQDTGQLVHSAIFALDIYQVAIGCGSLVFNMNGRVPDEGGVAEAAVAWTLGKPVLLFKEDVRSPICGRDNPLIAGQAGFETVADLLDLGRALRHRIAMHPVDRHWKTGCPPHLAQAISAGKRLWAELDALDGRDDAAIAEILLELFASPRPAVM